jgi:hypothetical protein
VSGKSATMPVILRASACGTQFEAAGGLCYSTGEPYEVRLEIGVGLEELVTWRFARGLLAQGLSGRAGEGDVAVWPSADGLDVVIRLSSPDGTVELTASAPSVARFLEATYCLVAAGAEPGRSDLDAGIAAILARGAS